MPCARKEKPVPTSKFVEQSAFGDHHCGGKIPVVAHGKMPIENALRCRDFSDGTVKEYMWVTSIVLDDLAVLPIHSRRCAEGLGYGFLGGKTGGQGPDMQIPFRRNEKPFDECRRAFQLRLESRYLDNIHTNSHDHVIEFICDGQGSPKWALNSRAGWASLGYWTAG